MSDRAYKPQSKNQQHITPQRVYDLILKNFMLKKDMLHDPCPIDIPFKAPCFFNGLYDDWHKFNYVNPPFEVKTLRLFYQKALEQSKKGNITVMLLPSKTDQDWFHDIIKKGFNIIWIKKRLKFIGNKHHATDCHFLVEVL